MRITFLSRPGCHLCDVALDELTSHLKARYAEPGGLRPKDVALDVVNIELDDRLHRRYLERIPVILVDGEEVSDLAFDAERLDAAITLGSEGEG